MIHPIQWKQNSENAFYLMREDLLPFSFGGNKVRIAQSYLEDMECRGCDYLLAYGNSRSNLCRVLANLCRSREIPSWTYWCRCPRRAPGKCSAHRPTAWRSTAYGPRKSSRPGAVYLVSILSNSLAGGSPGMRRRHTPNYSDFMPSTNTLTLRTRRPVASSTV